MGEGGRGKEGRGITHTHTHAFLLLNVMQRKYLADIFWQIFFRNRSVIFLCYFIVLFCFFLFFEKDNLEFRVNFLLNLPHPRNYGLFPSWCL